MAAAVVALAGCGGGGALCEGDYARVAGFDGAARIASGVACDHLANGLAVAAFPTLASAVKGAPAGSTVYVAEGRWAPPGAIARPIALVGRADAPDGAPRSVVTGTVVFEAAPGDGAEGWMVDVGVDGAAPVGLHVDGRRLRVERCAITRTGFEGAAGGHGVQVVGGGMLTLANSTVSANEGVGVLASGGALQLGASSVTGNGGGGVAVVGAADDALIAHADLSGNRVFGVALFDASATVARTTIEGTRARAEGGSADGVLVVRREAPEVSAVLDGVVIAGAERAGVSAHGGAAVSLAGEVRGCARGGLWVAGAGGEARVDPGSVVAGNRYFGLAAVDGARLIAEGFEASGTALGPVQVAGKAPGSVGDGVHLAAGARAQIHAAQLLDNARAGIAADHPDPSELVIEDVFITGGQIGVALQGLTGEESWPRPQPGEAGLTVKETEGDAVAIEAGLPMLQALCEGGDACVPAPPAFSPPGSGMFTFSVLRTPLRRPLR